MIGVLLEKYCFRIKNKDYLCMLFLNNIDLHGVLINSDIISVYALHKKYINHRIKFHLIWEECLEKCNTNIDPEIEKLWCVL